MKFQHMRMVEKEENNKKKLAPNHAPALYSNTMKAASSQSKIQKLHQKGGILMSTFIKNQERQQPFGMTQS